MGPWVANDQGTVLHVDRDCNRLNDAKRTREATDDERDRLRDCGTCTYAWVPTLD